MTEVLPTHFVDTQGAHVFTFPDGTRLDIVVLKHGPGYLLSEVSAMAGLDEIFNRATINLYDLQDRERFCRLAATMDGQAPWARWLLFAMEHVLQSIAPRWEPEHEGSGESRHNVDTSQISLASAVLSFQELMTLDIPERTRYIDWLPECGLSMVYGPRGCGKTMFMLGMAIGLTTGNPFLKWPIHQATGVLYIDGEMPLVELRERAVSLAQRAIPHGLHFLTGEMVYAKLKRDLVLTKEELRLAVDHIVDEHPDIHVVILDNISYLFSGISEDKKQDWEPINAWLVRLRHRGITAMLGHHAGKGGLQRGTSGREDSLDTVIAIDYPQNHRAEDGCHFHLRFTKSRSVKGEAVTALDVRLEEVPGEGLTWTVSTLDESRKERIRQMLDDGMSVSEIVKELEVSASYVHRIKREVSGQ